ncbi:DUF305 domain-containing protein [Candidatus Pacebacteria bacterium]|nr:DUF305 domain-containing protein [Candidatus Paceibacterota bacterium]
MKNIRNIIIFVLAIITAICLVVISSSKNNSIYPDTNSPEAGFARDMSIHHQQALEMSFLVRERSSNESIRSFAFDIINTQATQRGMMFGWLQLWDLSFTTAVEPMLWMDMDHHVDMGHEEEDSMDHHGTMDMKKYNFTPGAFMPGMATKEEMNQLADSTGRQSEKIFLELMIRHHQGGVLMAEGIVDLTEIDQVKNLAQTMIDGQNTEIEYMEELLKSY